MSIAAPVSMRPLSWLCRCFILLSMATLLCYLVPIAQAQVCCTHASSETSVAAGTAPSPYVGEKFTVTVKDGAGDNFGGRTVYEGDYQVGTDSCYFAGNTIGMAPGALTNGSSWQVNASNQYVDVIGWNSAQVVQYIRANAPAHGVSLPCGITVYQEITMVCSGGTDATYSTDIPTETIYSASVKSCRQGVCATINQ